MTHNDQGRGRMVCIAVMFLVGGFACSATAQSASPPATSVAFPTAELLSAERQASVLERAEFLTQQDSHRLQITAAMLQTMGAGPKFVLRVDNAVYYLSLPFRFGGGRQAAVGLVEVDGSITARVFYRSNSQFTWRLCDATIRGRHIGKGFHEYDMQLPVAVSAALLQRADEAVTLNKPSPAAASASPAQLAGILLDGLTEDFERGRAEGRVVMTPNNAYCSRTYAAFVPWQPMVFSTVHGWLPTARGKVANPKTIALPPQPQLPDFSKETASITYEHPRYAQVASTSSRLTGRVFDSHDGSARYLFFEDAEGRAVLSAVEALRAPVTPMGVRGRYFDLAGMDAPLIEYGTQIAGAFGGNEEQQYMLNWRYVRELPIIQHYYREQMRAVP